MRCTYYHTDRQAPTHMSHMPAHVPVLVPVVCTHKLTMHVLIHSRHAAHAPMSTLALLHAAHAQSHLCNAQMYSDAHINLLEAPELVRRGRVGQPR